jgi:hypothetical protein
MVRSFEQCAQECADTWFAKEAAFVADLASADTSRRLTALQRAAGHFKIARTMPTAYDVGLGRPRLAPVLELLDEPQLRNVTAAGLADSVGFVRRRLADAYHKADLLSAATKFLWLMNRDVAVIFDSQARTALASPPGDYEAYLARWRQRFEASMTEIKAACLRAASAPQGAGVRGLAGETWFPMRVFDIRLWYEGNARP